MKIVYKYNLALTDINLPILPVGAEILRVDIQGVREDPALWVLADPDEKVSKQRIIRIAGTGHPIKEKIIRYINTFHTNNRALWWHAFEVEL
jgi:hypothetical protein